MRQSALHTKVHTRGQQHHVVRTRRDGGDKGKHGHGGHKFHVEVHVGVALGHCV